MDLAERFIVDIKLHPSLIDGRQNDPVQIIDLAVIREALGEKWSSYAEAIHRIAARTIERHLDGAYGYTRRADCYVLSFKGAEAKIAAQRTREISLALATYLFGTGKNDPEPMAGRGRPGSTRVTGKARGFMARIINQVKQVLHLGRTVAARSVPRGRKKPNTAGIMVPDSTGRVGSLAEQPRSSLASAPGTASDISQTMATSSHALGEAANLVKVGGGRSEAGGPTRRPDVSAPTFTTPRQPIKTDSVAPSHQPEPVAPGGHPHSVAKSAEDGSAPEPAIPTAMAADVQSPSRSEPEIDPDEINALENAMLAAARRLAREGERQTHTPPVRGLHFFYRPMWSVRTSMMAISSCVPIARLPSGEMVTGAAVVPPGASSEFIQMVDNAALSHVLSDAQRLAQADRTTLASIPVHYETLVDKERRTAYLNLCQGLPTGARRRILFECLGIGQGTGQTELVAGIMALKPFSALLVGQLSLDTQNFAFWKGTGLSSVGVDIHEQHAPANGGEAELIERLERFVFLAVKSGLRPYVRGLNTLSLAAAAVAAGFDFIEGGIIQDQIEPSAVRSFTLQDLYLQFAATHRGPASATS